MGLLTRHEDNAGGGTVSDIADEVVNNSIGGSASVSVRETIAGSAAPAVSGLFYYGLMLFLIEFVRGAYLVSYLPSFAADHLGLSVAAVGVAISIHYLADNVLKSFIGYFLDRYSTRLIVSGGLLVSLAGMGIMHAAHSAWLLIAAAAVFGAGGSPVWLVCLCQVKEERRAAQMGYLYSFWLAGIGLGPVVINFLMDKGYGLPFAGLVSIWAAGWLLSLRLNPLQTGAFVQSSLKEQISVLLDRLAFTKLLVPGMMLQTTAAGMLVPVLSGFATKHIGLSHAEYSWVLITGGACAAIGLVPLGRLSDEHGMKWFLVGGFGALACSLYGLILVSGLPLALAAAALLGISYSAVLPAWNALLARFVPKEHQGMGWGLFSSVEGIGVMVGPMLGGWLAVNYGESATVVCSALLLAAMALIYGLLPMSRFVKERDGYGTKQLHG